MIFNYGYLWGLINGLEMFRNILYTFLLYLQDASRCWVMYDEQYRLKKSRYPTSSLGIVDEELWLFCFERDNAIYPYFPASYDQVYSSRDQILENQHVQSNRSYIAYHTTSRSQNQHSCQVRSKSSFQR